MKKRNLVLATLGVTALVLYFGLLNFKPFVDFVFEFGDEKVEGEFHPNESAVGFETTLREGRQIVYGPEILQPSGISIRDERILVVTDTSDIFLVNSEGNTIDSARLKGGPLLLRQGYAEGVAWTGESSAAVIAGEGTQLILLSVSQNEVSVDETLAIDVANSAGSEVQAIGYYEKNDAISLTLAGTDAVRTVWLTRSGDVIEETEFEISGVDPETQDVQGSAIQGDTLYLLLKRNVVVEIDLDGNEVLRVSALAYDGDTSGVSVAGDELFVVTDHEYYEDSPTLRSFDLPR